VKLLDPDGDIPDPMGASLEEYKRVGERMWKLVTQLAEEIVET
jgi:protein-tyrosine-phosphatase